jgi:sigma-B regulation protein RsbU (phosphoserine phosphatase)
MVCDENEENMDIVTAIKSSPELLNTVFDHMTSAVFIVDKTLDVRAFNSSFETWFKGDSQEILNHLCGNVLGCVYTSLENVECGNTTFCKACELRNSIVLAIENGTTTTNQMIEREFEVSEGFVLKFFRFTCKALPYDGEIFAVLMLDDVTDIEISKRELQEQNRTIRNMNHKFQQELQLAKKVQASIIPKKAVSFGAYNIHFKYIPLEDIGGDMFDIYEIDESKIGIFICDVIGHGLPAALITTMVKAFIATSRNILNNPSLLMSTLNNQLIDILDNPYMTSIYGVLDKVENTFKFVRAGHPLPWLLETEVSVIGKERSPMLGIIRDVQYKEESISLRENAKLLLYTDGLTEAKTAFGDYENRLKEMITANRQASGAMLLELMMDDFEQVHDIDKHQDDVCMLIIDRKSSCVQSKLIG